MIIEGCMIDRELGLYHMQRKLVVFDADGVLFDSVDEVTISTYNAYNRVTGSDRVPVFTLEEVPEPIVRGIRIYRPLLLNTGDFLRVIHAICTGKEQRLATAERLEDVVQLEDAFVERFKQRKYDFRAQEFIPKREAFLRVMRPYPDAVQQYATLLSTEGVVGYIVSTRDTTSITAALRGYHLPCREGMIRHPETGNKAESIHELIRETGIPPTQTYFFDDYVSTLVRVKQDPRLAGMHVYLARWGYVNDRGLRTAEVHGIPVIQQGEIGKCVQ